MQGKKRRKTGLLTKKRKYNVGGSFDCPNPPCPPVNPPVSPGLDVPGPTNQGEIRPDPQGVPPNAAWMYQAMPAFQDKDGMAAAAKWTEENPLSSAQGLNMMGMLNALGTKALAMRIPGTAIGGLQGSELTLGHIFNAYLLNEGIEGFKRDIPEFFDDPSWEGLKNLGIDALQVLPGSSALYSNVVKPVREIVKSGRSYFAGDKSAETLDIPFQFVDDVVDPVKGALNQLKTTVQKPMSVVRQPPIPVMEEARFRAVDNVLSVYAGGTSLGTDTQIRLYTIDDLDRVAEAYVNSVGGDVEQVKKAILAKVDEDTPRYINEVMRGSEGNILDVPYDTRRPDADRIRMRFLGPNSKLWQQAGKNGLLSLQNLKQALSGMSDLEEDVLQQALVGTPIYNKRGELLRGQDLEKAHTEIENALFIDKGSSVNLSQYKINLNQLKGTTEQADYNRAPLRTIHLHVGQKDGFGANLGSRSKYGLTPFSNNTWSDYGLARLGYNVDEYSAKTYIVGSDNFVSSKNHFGKGELSHFRGFMPGGGGSLISELSFPNALGTIPKTVRFDRRFRQLDSGVSFSTDSGVIEWQPDMSRVPSGLGITGAGGSYLPSPDIQDIATSIASNPFDPKMSYNALNAINVKLTEPIRFASTLTKEALALQNYGSPLVETNDAYKQVFDLANRGDIRSFVRSVMADFSESDQIMMINHLEAIKSFGLQEVQSYMNLSNAQDIDALVTGGAPMSDVKNSMVILDRTPDAASFVSNKNPLSQLYNSSNANVRGAVNAIQYYSSLPLSDIGKTDWWLGQQDRLRYLYGNPASGGNDGAVSMLNQFAQNDFSEKVQVLQSVASSRGTDELREFAASLEQIGVQLGENSQEYTKLAGEALAIANKLNDYYAQESQRIIERGERSINPFSGASDYVNKNFSQDVQALHSLYVRMQEIYNRSSKISQEFSSSVDLRLKEIISSIPETVQRATDQVKLNIDRALQQVGTNLYYDIIKAETELRSNIKQARSILSNREALVSDENFFNSVMGVRKSEGDQFFVAEIQSDFVQKSGGKQSNLHNVDSGSGDTTFKGDNSSLDSFAKNWRVKTIQQSVLQARKEGKNQVLFPTYETANLIQSWKGSKDSGVEGSGNRITYQNMDKHILKATGVKPTPYKDNKGNTWWMIELDPDQNYEFPDFRHGGKIRLRKK